MSVATINGIKAEALSGRQKEEVCCISIYHPLYVTECYSETYFTVY